MIRAYSRGKQSIALNLKSEAGRDARLAPDRSAATC